MTNLAAFGGVVTTIMLNSSVSGNTANDAGTGGGGVTNFAVAGTDATTGGILPSHAALTISNSTISGNSASANGAGVYNTAVDPADHALVTLRNVTVTDNYTTANLRS